MRRFAFLFALVLLLSGCRLYDVWYKREFREVNDRLKAIPGVTVVASGGNDDVTFEDIYAQVDISGHGTITLAQLTSEAFSGDAPFYVCRIGVNEPRITSFGFNGVWNDKGQPVKSVTYGGALAIGDSELARDLCCQGIRSVPEVIAGISVLERELSGWPRCPEFNEKEGAGGMSYRYCVATADRDFYPPEKGEWMDQAVVAQAIAGH